MVLNVNTGDAVTSGQTITTGSQPASGTPFDMVLGTWKGTTDPGEVIFGAGAYKTTMAADTYLRWSLAGPTKAAARAYYRLPVQPGNTGVLPLLAIHSAAKLVTYAYIGTDGKLHWNNSAQGDIWQLAVPLGTFPAVFGLDVAVDVGTTTTDGVIQVAYYDAAGAFTFGTSGPLTQSSANLGAGQGVALVRFGIYGNNNGATQPLIVDSIAAQDDSVLLGPYTGAPNMPPVANAGPDQTVDPWGTVTLDGSGSRDPDGTVTSYAWSQTAGPAVTLSSTTAVKPTFTAPAGVTAQTLTFALVVTDDKGAASAPDAIDVVVHPATEWAAVGGNWSPLRLQDAVPPPETVTNRVPSPKLTSTAGWVTSRATAAVDTGHGRHPGTSALLLTEVTSGAGQTYMLQGVPAAQQTDVVDGQPFTGLLSVFPGPGAGGVYQMLVYQYDAAGTMTGTLTSTPQTAAAGQWTDLRFKFTPAATTVSIRFGFLTSVLTTPGMQAWVSEPLVTDGDYNGGYFDGDTTPTTGTSYAWTGEPNASPSTATPNP